MWHTSEHKPEHHILNLWTCFQQNAHTHAYIHLRTCLELCTVIDMPFSHDCIAACVLRPQQVAPRWWQSGRSCPAAMLLCTRSAHVSTTSPSPSPAPSAVPSKPAPAEIPPRHTFGWCQLQEIVAPLMPRRFPSPSWGTDGCHAVYSPFWGLVGCQSLPPSRGAPVTSPFWGAPVTSSFCGASVPSPFWGATVPFPSVDLNIYSICVQICSGWKLNGE